MKLPKFRAKSSIDGEWVESMTIASGTTGQNKNNLYFEIDEGNWAEVDKSTLEQVQFLDSEIDKVYYTQDYNDGEVLAVFEDPETAKNNAKECGCGFGSARLFRKEII